MNSQLSKSIQFTLMLFMVLAMTTRLKAAVVNIPTQAGSYISWNDATGSNYNVENNGANVGSTGKNTVLSFTINNSQLQDYRLTFKTGSKMEAEMKLTMTHANGNVVLSKNVVIENTNSWTPSIEHSFILEQLQVGTYTLTFPVTTIRTIRGRLCRQLGRLGILHARRHRKHPWKTQLSEWQLRWRRGERGLQRGVHS